MATISHRRCTECKTRYELIEVSGAFLRMTHDDVEGLGCPGCGEEGFDRLLSRGGGAKHRNRASEDVLYPYFNRGLGVMLESAEHKKRVMKEMGVVEAPGLDITKQAEEDGAFSLQNAREYNEYVEEMEGSAEHADWRRERDLTALGR